MPQNNNMTMSRTKHSQNELLRIKYRTGMLERGMKPKDLPLRIWTGNEIPAEVKTAIKKERLARLGGVHGDPMAGYPVEYGYLHMFFGSRETIEITFYNRGITLFLSDEEGIKRIHRVFCKLDMIVRRDEES